MTRADRSASFLLLALALLAPERIQAQAEPGVAEPEQTESFSRFTLGLGAFGGGRFSEHERQGGGGGNFVAAIAVVPERWEVELGLSLIASFSRSL